MRHLHRALLPFVLSLACGGGSEVGAPCDKDEQCGGDLICDVHEGKGTCQTPHEHVSGGAGTTGAATDPTGGSTSTATTGATTGTTGGSTAASTTEAVDELCMDYCACLEAHCAALGQFPHADAAACESACTGFTAEERTCWAAYCVFAAMEDAAHMHYCEHASGSLGLAECG